MTNRAYGLRRTREDILSEILEACLEEINKKEICWQANLNSVMVAKHLKTLIKHKFVELSDDKYKTTEKGMDFLSTYKVMQDSLQYDKVNHGLR